jgi:hypothetical protein|nr:MAG TPA: hypothetical protein [Caudoviricetes sp.]
MSFTTPCFIQVKDQEKRKELKKWLSGIYRVISLYYTEDCEYIRCYTNYKGYAIAADYPTRQVKKFDIDCGENIEMFKALAAMNDENDYIQWFIDDNGWFLCRDYRLTIPTNNAMHTRKATADDIIKRYKPQ